MQLSMFSEEELPASPIQSQDFAKELLILEANSCLSLVQSLIALSPHGFYGRTSPESCQLTEDGILAPSSGCWQNSGMGMPTEFLTLSTSEHNDIAEQSLNDEGVSLLSDILEIGALPHRYFLSARACRGILLRAEKRDKELPPMLRMALEAVASAGPK